MILANVLALAVVFVAVPLNWLVTIRLWRLSGATPEISVLRERAILSTFFTVLVTVFALVFLNNDLAVPILTLDQTRIIVRSATLAVSIVPAGYWLYLYR